MNIDSIRRETRDLRSNAKTVIAPFEFRPKQLIILWQQNKLPE